MMLRVLVLCLLVIGVPASAQTPAVAPLPPDPRIDAHLLRVENAQLRALVAKLQTELEAAKLSAERRALEEMLRAEQKPPTGAVFNWQTLTFDPPKEPK